MFDTLTVYHRSELRTRYGETDQMGIVWHGNYLYYFEIGRTELLRAAGLPYAEIEARGVIFPVVETALQFKTPARYDDLLYIHTTATVRRSPILYLEYNITRKEQDGSETPIVSGHTKLAFAQTGTVKPIRPPQWFFDALLAYTEHMGQSSSSASESAS